MLLRPTCCWLCYRSENCLQSPNEVICQLSSEFGGSCENGQFYKKYVTKIVEKWLNKIVIEVG